MRVHMCVNQQSCQSQNQSNRERKVISTNDVVTTGYLYGGNEDNHDLFFSLYKSKIDLR